MSARNWDAARKRDLVRDRGYTPARDPRPAPVRRPPKPPTQKQLRFLADLAKRAGVPVPSVKTRAEAHRAIDALVKVKPPTRRQLKAIRELATELGVHVPPPTTRADAFRDLAMLESWLKSRGDLPLAEDRTA